ncbi:MAG TPA: tol-pal system protein YbgF [Stellaceae bacterium]|jgi:tol-pal system protein YbgF|nr:tol-pal system protein YbgF [Stellaceae bacterium]
MFRRLLLACACLTVALGPAAVVAAAPAWSQDRSAQDRLDRLERDINMLQRQVYRGAPAPAAGEGGGAVNTEIRMDRLESQMRDLTGRVEEFTNQINQVRQRVEQVNSDVEMRFSQGGGTPGATAAAAPPPARPGSARGDRQFPPAPADALDDDAPAPRQRRSPSSPLSSMPPGTAVPPPGETDTYGGRGPSAMFGTLTPPGMGPAASQGDASELANTATADRAGGTLPSGSATEQYNYAFGLLKQANYPAAESALKTFVDAHPKDAMAGNAQYWLGETYYTRGKYMEAATVFAEGYKRYPKSTKAPDGLLKLGMALARANQKQNACVALSQLDHDFPHAGASIKERAAGEKKRLGC